MLVEAVALFLGVSLLLYVLLGGADFGAGIAELILRKSRNNHQDVVTHALGPVWEANHMWLILALVITFVAFPTVFAALSTQYHIPLTCMLLGIVFRGCAFTFRHYDVQRDEWHRHYTNAFQVMSVLTPLFLGFIVGGLLTSPFEVPATTFAAAYVEPWFTLFGFVLGVFFCLLCLLLAVVFLIGEVEEPLQHTYRKLSARTLIATLVAGALVFVVAFATQHDVTTKFFSNPWSLVCYVAASVSAAVLVFAIKGVSKWKQRIAVSALASFVLFGWFALQFPNFATLGADAKYTLYSAAAPEATLKSLLWCLVSGSVLIFPALGFLFRVFKA